MKRYETIVIIDPDLTEEQRTPLFERFEDVISKGNGILVQNDQWGSKKLAYDIKKKNRGFYSRFDYCGTAALVDEMERVLRIDDGVLKYMTVLQSPIVELEKIEEEKAQLQAQADEKKARAEAQAEEKKEQAAAQAEKEKTEAEAQTEEKSDEPPAPAPENAEATGHEEPAAEPEAAPETSEPEANAGESDEGITEKPESTKEEQA